MLDFSAFSRRDQPFFSQAEIPEGLNFSKLIDAIPEAYAQGQVRLIDEQTPNEGYPIGWLSTKLKREISSLSNATIHEIIAKRLCTIAVQSMDRFDQTTADIADELRRQTGRRVSVTAFFSPPKSKGTSIHYDRSDVFVLHVAGSKRWNVYQPIEIEPNHRTPYQDPIAASNDLHFAGEWKLERGQSLYLPSGWIHEVLNESDKPCLHLSFVIFSDSFISVFGNAMTESYSRLVQQHEWRQHLSSSDLTKSDVIERFSDMLNAFSRTFFESLADDPARFCDHVLNPQSEQVRRMIARKTISVIDEDDVEVFVDWIGISHRAIRNGGQIEISIDGSQRYGVHPNLYFACKEKKTMSLSSLAAAYDGTEDDVVDFVAVMVRDLGLLSLRAIPVNCSPRI